MMKLTRGDLLQLTEAETRALARYLRFEREMEDTGLAELIQHIIQRADRIKEFAEMLSDAPSSARTEIEGLMEKK